MCGGLSIVSRPFLVYCINNFPRGSFRVVVVRNVGGGVVAPVLFMRKWRLRRLVFGFPVPRPALPLDI